MQGLAASFPALTNHLYLFKIRPNMFLVVSYYTIYFRSANWGYFYIDESTIGCPSNSIFQQTGLQYFTTWFTLCAVEHVPNWSQPKLAKNLENNRWTRSIDQQPTRTESGQTQSNAHWILSKHTRISKSAQYNLLVPCQFYGWWIYKVGRTQNKRTEWKI